MKVLIMNDSLVGGGTEMQGIREKKILESKGNEVILLTFDNNYPQNNNFYNQENGFYNIPLKKNMLSMAMNSYIFNGLLYKKINQIIKEFKPDIIHVNHLYTATLTQLKAIRSVKNIQTIRDYAAVCPLATCIKPNGQICSGYKDNNCYYNCGKSIKKFGKIVINSRNNKLRKKYINKFLCPSERLTQYCSEHGYNVTCVNNPFDFEKIKDFKKEVKFDKKKYLYYGVINDDKGVIPFINAFTEFCRDKDVELIIAGKVKDDTKVVFNECLKKCKNIKYIGFLNYDEMLKTLNDIHTVVVPSKWMENYPNTVLESHATGTLVIGSNRGGIPNMLSENRGFVFDIDNKESIIEILEVTYKLSSEEYNDIVKCAKEYVLNNNSFDKYYYRIINQFKN